MAVRVPKLNGNERKDAAHGEKDPGEITSEPRMEIVVTTSRENFLRDIAIISSGMDR
jgi:hypothetical protein